MANGPWLVKTILFLDLDKEFLNDRMVQVGGDHHESSAIRPNANCNVSTWNIVWDSAGRHARLAPPPPQHFSKPQNVADFTAQRGHFTGKLTEKKESKSLPV
ncbi:hypothetical protein F3Y22_tig00110163pilonHSYRG00181 [Hibiscus syriacus]|uniref:Uncharacterized protein n=1 Tax=Hibiscus syriacus TaxID=106335 RepID=A0A6A3BEP5_HIBSY|nr:hypothetical protein F3Y22_tig00110163pilonHSYRG00181 [Hibiscus syriacus]